MTIFYTDTYMVLLERSDKMDITQILPLLTNMCIYYYTAYHEKILNQIVSIPGEVFPYLMNKIYSEYLDSKNESFVYDIMIMQFPYNKQYTLKEDYLDAVEIMARIDNYIDNHVYYYNTTIPINVISLSNHPIENYFHLDHSWIKWTIDMYRY